MAVTSVDVARLAGVSQPTVSRALRGDPRVSESTRQRVAEAARRLGYVPSDVGRSLSTRTTRQVAMVADLDNPLYPQLVPSVHDELAELGYRMVLLAERGDEMVMYDRLLDRSVDGAVLTTTQLRSSLPYELSRRQVPFVFLNRVNELVDGDSATAANSAGGAQVAELLVKLGHSHIGAILAPTDLSTTRDREAGFREVLDNAGVALPARRVQRASIAHQQGHEGFKALMATSKPPTAVFCVSDVLAIGALNAAMELGVTVPDDVALVGFDDLDVASWPVFQLTTVHIPFADMARTAARQLVQRIRAGGDGPVPQQEVFPTSLVLRRTHGG